MTSRSFAPRPTVATSDTRIIPAIAFPGQIHPFDHLVSAWHGSNGAYLTPFPRVTEDWMFASAPILASAAVVLFFVVIVALTFAQWLTFRRRVHYTT